MPERDPDDELNRDAFELLSAHPGWNLLREGVREKLAWIQNRIVFGMDTDPHEIGKLRGEANVYRMLLGDADALRSQFGPQTKGRERDGRSR